jgi:hypothetical protein
MMDSTERLLSKQSMLQGSGTAIVFHCAEELAAADLDHDAWRQAQPLWLTGDRGGKTVHRSRHAEVRLLWTTSALHVRFACRQEEPLVVNPRPSLKHKCRELPGWDVCELFLAPDPARPRRYCEFEAAPTGEWFDLIVEHTAEGCARDLMWDSQMTCAARQRGQELVIAMKLPFGPMEWTPKAGDCRWGNLFRCVGSEPTRGYLAWRPVGIEAPGTSFHAPSAFGQFLFVDAE